MTVQTYECVPTGRARVWLRRWLWESSSPFCTKRKMGERCRGTTLIGDTHIRWAHWDAEGPGFHTTTGDDPERIDVTGAEAQRAINDEDPRWPRLCDACKRDIPANAERAIITKPLYDVAGKIVTALDFKPGAMFDAWWLTEPSVHVVLPDGRHWTFTRTDDGYVDPRNAWTIDAAGLLEEITPP